MIGSERKNRISVGQPRRQRGVSLIEILVTILVVAVGLLGMAGLQTVSLQYNHSSYMRTHATNMAHEIADRMRANREAAVDNEYNIDTEGNDPPSGGSTVAEQDLREWWLAVDRVLPSPQTKITVDNNGGATITLKWLDERDQNSDEVKKTSFTVETRI